MKQLFQLKQAEQRKTNAALHKKKRNVKAKTEKTAAKI